MVENLFTSGKPAAALQHESYDKLSSVDISHFMPHKIYMNVRVSSLWCISHVKTPQCTYGDLKSEKPVELVTVVNNTIQVFRSRSNLLSYIASQQIYFTESLFSTPTSQTRFTQIFLSCPLIYCTVICSPQRNGSPQSLHMI